MAINSDNKDMGKELEDRMNYIAEQFEALQPKTLIHGDYKISNVFIVRHNNKTSDSPSSSGNNNNNSRHYNHHDNSNNEDGDLYAIDWQWFGQGNGATDVAYFIATSVHKDYLDQEQHLLRVYYDALCAAGVSGDYSFETFYNQYQICWIDFFMYTVVAKWANMTAKDFVKYQDERKDGLHLRSYAHMRKLVENTQMFLYNLKNGERNQKLTKEKKTK